MAEEERYSNRQIEKMLDDQSRDIKGHIDFATKPILTEVIKTNGRVTTLEKKQEKDSNYRTGMAWAGAVIFFFLTTFILPILTWNVLETIKLKGSIQDIVSTAVDEAFADNLEP